MKKTLKLLIGGAMSLPLVALLLWTAPVAVMTTGCASLGTNSTAVVIADLVDGLIIAGGPALLQMELQSNPSIAPAVGADLQTTLLAIEILQDQTNAITQLQVDQALSLAGLKTPQAQTFVKALVSAFDSACGAATAAGINDVAFLPQFLDAVETAITTGLNLTPTSLAQFRTQHGLKAMPLALKHHIKKSIWSKP